MLLTNEWISFKVKCYICTVSAKTYSEGVKDQHGLLVLSEDPPLVSNLDLENPKFAASNSGLDQVVLASLIAVR